MARYGETNWGLVNWNGSLALPCEYSRIEQFWKEKDICVVVKNDKYGVINRRYELIIPCVYERIQYDLSGGLLNCINGKWGLMDVQQRPLIPNRYDYMYGFEQIAWKQHASQLCKIKNNGLYGYVNLQGVEVMPPKFTFLYDGLYYNRVIFGEKERYGFADSTGRIAVPAVYERVMPFRQLLTPVLKNQKWGLIDTAGNLVASCAYIETGTVYEKDYYGRSTATDRYWKVRQAGGWGVIDTQGREVLPCKYEEIHYIMNGAFTVRLGGKQLQEAAKIPLQ